MAGIPAMSVPSGLASDTGLPVGLQIMAPALGEQAMYRVAGAYEQARTESAGHAVLDRIGALPVAGV
jgi:aspartyl-tRNA(Asn)/glutamyl-tRNA(Gln) amidotransferase subunit A